MSGLSSPFVYECPNCDRGFTIPRDDVTDLAVNPDGLKALKIVLQQHGWLRIEPEGKLWCPDCVCASTED